MVEVNNRDATDHVTAHTMSLPASLRASVTPPELELIATQQLVEIIPLIAMEKTAFISVCVV